MPSLPKLERLLSALRDRCFQRATADIPLRWTQSPPELRDQMVSGPHDNWQPLSPDTIWGEPQSYFWFVGKAEVPAEHHGQRLYLWIEAEFGRVMGRSDPQCLVRVNGEIVQGADFNHREILLTDNAVAGTSYEILIEAGTIENRRQAGFACWLLTHDAEAEALYFDLKTPLDVARHLPETDHRRDLILTTVYEALNTLDLRNGNPARFADSIGRARTIANRIYETTDTEATPKITVTGHTHIDVAWLWRVRETRQKMARSMATALTLMHEYPDYKFMYNQGYLLDTLSQDYPALFDGLKDAQDRGQFEIEGALWLEPDANMTNGESLVRHILRGIRYHEAQFGVRPKIVWLPDTFGYSAALPQIMKLCGLEVFVTHKMSWNDTNRIPNETFWWEGIDGSRVPTYFLTTQPMESTSIGTTYCPDLKATHVMGTWKRYAQKGTNDELFLVYGHGDGGGGPTREMLEHIRRMERGIPGCPRIEHGHMGPYFDRLVARMNNAPEKYPAWVGELYLESHRGTFTSVAKVKRNNRRAEAELREIEALASLAALRSGFSYPKEQIDRLWDVVLLNQFHDILPGSSIGLVYDDSDQEFKAFFAESKELKTELSATLAKEGEVLIPNPLGHERSGIVQIASDSAISVGGQSAQPVHRADGRVLWGTPVKGIPALGAARFAKSDAPQAAGNGGLVATPTKLENTFLRATFDATGRLTSFFDKIRNREALSGPANRMQAFRDIPEQFDAWDIDTTFEDQFWEIDNLVSAEVVETGPYRAAIRFEWQYETSRFVQVVSLAADAKLLEFDTFIDWREQNTLVKAAFPLDLQSTASTAEIQFGHTARPSHANTSWDEARFECPMHRWVDISEKDFGVALLNDCKYGYDAKGNTLRLTILRAPTWPWDGADIGEHHLRYGLFLHGDISEVSPVAEAFNHPLCALPGKGSGSPSLQSVASPDNPAIAVEAVKRAEDSDAIVLRLWERNGTRNSTQITLAPEVISAEIANMLEQTEQILELQEHKVTLAFQPFEIKTLLLRSKA